MSTVPMPSRRLVDNGYPTGDGKPMAETDLHRELMTQLIEVLRRFHLGQQVYVTGNILVFYEQGNRRRHVSPDVWLARGVEDYLRPNYLIWQEPRGPEFVIEMTSSSTRREDQTTKLALYRDTLRVREYFLFDPEGDYLDPQLQGYRLRGNAYQRIRPRDGRLPSQVTGLHLEQDGTQLRLWNPATQAWLPTPGELLDQTQDALAETQGELAQAQGVLEQNQGKLEQAEQQIEELAQENQTLAQQNALLQQQLAQLRGSRPSQQ
jgi:Uma2 family endonuclease